MIKKNDIILISAVFAVAALLSLLLFLTKTEGDTVTVTVDGELLYELSLSEDKEIKITGKDGSGHNILVIKDGEAFVREASCPDGICSSHRPIKLGGESIICLPNKVVIEIVKKEADSIAPDIIV